MSYSVTINITGTPDNDEEYEALMDAITKVVEGAGCEINIGVGEEEGSHEHMHRSRSA